MQIPATTAGWIDHRWAAIGKILPTVTMDWLYQEDGADRLKHHRWMLTRPSFRATARNLHRTLVRNGDVAIRSVMEGEDDSFDYPAGMQRTLALRFFRHLQKPDGAEVHMFLVATACELIGTTPLCAYQEAQLREWAVKAANEAVPHFGTAYNLIQSVVAQTLLWVVGCLPYTTLQLKITPSSSVNHIVFRVDADLPDGDRMLLRRYSLMIFEKLQRIGRPSPVPRTYRESEEH